MSAAPVRVGLIGAGRWGQVHIRTLADLAERCRLTHLCTSDPQRAKLVSHPVTALTDWRRLIDSDCDAVIIATPPSTHADMVEACVEAGKPCLVEKPLCLDVATAERLHRRVAASGVPVLVNHTHLFSSHYRSLKRAVREAGEPIRLLVSEGMSLGPFRTHTSALWDWCPHDLSLCLDLIGEVPQRVDALGGPRGPGDAPEQVSVRLDFPGGSSAWIHAGRLSPQKRRSFSVFTDHGLYVWDDVASEPLTVSTIDFPQRYAQGIPETPERLPLAPTSSLPPMASALLYFVDGLAGGDRTYFGCGLALEVTRLLAACDEAMRLRQPVPARR